MRQWHHSALAVESPCNAIATTVHARLGVRAAVVCSVPRVERVRLFAVMFARYAEFCASLLATCSQYAAAVLGFHTKAEAVLVHALSVVGLKCSFHCLIRF